MRKALFVGGPMHGKIQAVRDTPRRTIRVPKLSTPALFFRDHDELPKPWAPLPEDTITYVKDVVGGNTGILEGRIEFFRPTNMDPREAKRLLNTLPASTILS